MKHRRALAAYSSFGNAKTESKEEKCARLIKQIFGSDNESKDNDKIGNTIIQTVSQVLTNKNKYPYPDKSEDYNTVPTNYITTEQHTALLDEGIHSSDTKHLTIDVNIPSLPNVSVLTSDPMQWKDNVKMELVDAERLESPLCSIYMIASKSQIHKRHKSTTSKSSDQESTPKQPQVSDQQSKSEQPQVSDKLPRVYMPTYEGYELDPNLEHIDKKLEAAELKLDGKGLDVLKHTTGVPSTLEKTKPVETIENEPAGYYERQNYPTPMPIQPSPLAAPRKQGHVGRIPRGPIPRVPLPSDSPLRPKESDPFSPTVKVPKPSDHSLDNFVSNVIEIKKATKSSSDSSESIKSETKNSADSLDISEIAITEERTGLKLISPLKRPKLYDSLPPTKTDLEIIERIAKKIYGQSSPRWQSPITEYNNQIKGKVCYLSKDDTQKTDSKTGDLFTNIKILSRHKTDQLKGSNIANLTKLSENSIKNKANVSNKDDETKEANVSNLYKDDAQKTDSKSGILLTKTTALDNPVSNPSPITQEENTDKLPILTSEETAQKTDSKSENFSINITAVDQPVSNPSPIIQKENTDKLPILITEETAQQTDFKGGNLFSNTAAHDHTVSKLSPIIEGENADKLPILIEEETLPSPTTIYRRKPNFFDQPRSPLDTYTPYFRKTTYFPSPIKGEEMKTPPSPLRITLSNPFQPTNGEISFKYNSRWNTIKEHSGPLTTNENDSVVIGDTTFCPSSTMPKEDRQPRMQVVLKDKAKARVQEKIINDTHLNSDRAKVEENMSTSFASLPEIDEQAKSLRNQQEEIQDKFNKLIETLRETEDAILSKHHQGTEEQTEKPSEMLRKVRLRNRLQFCQSYYTYMMMKQAMVLFCKKCGRRWNRCGCPPCPPYPPPPTPPPQAFTPCPAPNKVPPCPPPLPPKIPVPPIPPYCKECPKMKRRKPKVNAKPRGCAPPCPQVKPMCEPKKPKSCDKFSAVKMKSIIDQILEYKP